MRTLVDINENVLKEAMDLSEATTKKEAITLALEELIKSRFRQRLKRLAGSGMIETDHHRNHRSPDRELEIIHLRNPD